MDTTASTTKSAPDSDALAQMPIAAAQKEEQKKAEEQAAASTPSRYFHVIGH